MNGKRVKALRRQVLETRGWEPHKGEREYTDNKEAVNGVWRNAYDFHGMLYGTETMRVIEPSEWRRLKKSQ